MSDDLWRLSASEIAARIAAKEISAKDAVASAVARMRAANPALNAVVADLGDAAIGEAATLDAKFAKGGPVGPLHGVPITIKVNVDQNRSHVRLK